MSSEALEQFHSIIQQEGMEWSSLCNFVFSNRSKAGLQCEWIEETRTSSDKCGDVFSTDNVLRDSTYVRQNVDFEFRISDERDTLFLGPGELILIKTGGVNDTIILFVKASLPVDPDDQLVIQAVGSPDVVATVADKIAPHIWVSPETLVWEEEERATSRW